MLDTYVRLGIKGIKIDFMNRGDQGVVTTIWEDGDAPDAVQERELDVTAKDRLDLQLARAC